MFSVTVKDHMMIAHSLPDPFFGDAQNLHGATYVVDAEFSSKSLNKHNVVLDMGEAADAINVIIKTLNYKNLDDLDIFKDQLTTTEFLAKFIHSQLRKKFEEQIHIKITLHESHVASAAYGDQMMT